jgi:hypothetical protein
MSIWRRRQHSEGAFAAESVSVAPSEAKGPLWRPRMVKILESAVGLPFPPSVQAVIDELIKNVSRVLGNQLKILPRHALRPPASADP